MHRYARSEAGIVGFLIASTLISASAGSLADEVTLSTVDGKRFAGEVISGTVNTLNVNQTAGGYTMIPRRDIEIVTMAGEGGTVVEGGFLDWQDGLFTLRVDDRVVNVRDGIIADAAGGAFEPAILEDAPAEGTIDVDQEATGDEALHLPSEPIEHPTM